MIARYSQIRQQVSLINNKLDSPGHVQKIYSTSRYLCMQVRLKGHNVVLAIGRGNGYEGLWLTNEMPKSCLRIKDRWLEWCRKNLSSCLIQSVELDTKDRIIKLEFRRGGKELFLYVAWLGRNCFFALREENSTYKSWEGFVESNEDFEMFDKLGRKKINDDGEALNKDFKLLLAEEEDDAGKNLVQKINTKTLKSKIKKIENDLLKLKQWVLVSEWLEKNSVHQLIGAKNIKIGDHTIKFPLNLNEWQKRDHLFLHIKKMKTGEMIQEKRLAESNREISSQPKQQVDIKTKLRPLGPIWKMNEVITNIEKKIFDDEYFVVNFEGYKIGVGKTAIGNDQMRKKWGSENDWWVHSATQTSAHAIIKVNNSGVVAPAQLQNAAKLIANQSGINARQIEIIFTQLKNVRGVTGTPGMVTYKKSKKLLCDITDGDIK